MSEQDNRNVIDEFKGKSELDIIQILDDRGHRLVIALENTEREFSMGTIVRSANAFGVRDVYVIGRKQWNKRGAMMTDKYLRVHYFPSVDEFVNEMRRQKRSIVVIDNIEGSLPASQVKLPELAVLVFGQEGPGISPEMVAVADMVVKIEQFGSTRSLNVATAATVAMYIWLQQHVLTK